MSIVAGKHNQMMGDNDWNALNGTLNPQQKEAEAKAEQTLSQPEEKPQVEKTASSDSLNQRTGIIEQSLDDLHADISEHQTKQAYLEDQTAPTPELHQDILLEIQKNFPNIATMLFSGDATSKTTISVLRNLASGNVSALPGLLDLIANANPYVEDQQQLD